MAIHLVPNAVLKDDVREWSKHMDKMRPNLQPSGERGPIHRIRLRSDNPKRWSWCLQLVAPASWTPSPCFELSANHSRGFSPLFSSLP
jgi:hypothetical protein